MEVVIHRHRKTLKIRALKNKTKQNRKPAYQHTTDIMICIIMFCRPEANAVNI